jgi:hypothetical protein
MALYMSCLPDILHGALPTGCATLPYAASRGSSSVGLPFYYQPKQSAAAMSFPGARFIQDPRPMWKHANDYSIPSLILKEDVDAPVGRLAFLRPISACTASLSI